MIMIMTHLGQKFHHHAKGASFQVWISCLLIGLLSLGCVAVRSEINREPAGCCGHNMMPKPGSSRENCSCVYPIILDLLVNNVSVNFLNWSAEFQQELATQLNLSVIQIEITYFKFNDTNLTLSIELGPLIGDSFSQEQGYILKTYFDEHKVHLNNSLFGNYELRKFQHLEQPALPPLASTPVPTLSPSPISHVVSQGASDGHGTKSNPQLGVPIGIGVTILALVSFLAISIWRCMTDRNSGKNPYEHAVKGTSSQRTGLTGPDFDVFLSQPTTSRMFSYEELSEATNNFEPGSILGQGGSGRVYKGCLRDGTAVAIKRLTSGSHQGDQEFLVEVEMLSRLHHRNLVKLIGYYKSQDSNQHLVCYELVANNSLETWLHGHLGASNPLDWDLRIKIALDAARGLAYLHEDCQPCVIHRDFKSSNILLENNFHAKVADFGLAKQAPEGCMNYVSTRVMGTFGYVAPEYAMTGHLIVKNDVYSYGVVLLELLSGRRPVDMSRPPGQESLVTWARPILKDSERLTEFADPRLLSKYPKDDFSQVAAIAAACVAPEATQRPTMGEVVQSLKMVQRYSEHAVSGEREVVDKTQEHMSMSNRSLLLSSQNMRQTSTTFESDGSSSVFSSGAYSRFGVPDTDNLSRTGLFSEDLQEGR